MMWYKLPGVTLLNLLELFPGLNFNGSRNSVYRPILYPGKPRWIIQVKDFYEYCLPSFSSVQICANLCNIPLYLVETR